MNICFVFQGHTDEEAELWLEEIQTAIDNANKDAQFGLKCKSYSELDIENPPKNYMWFKLPFFFKKKMYIIFHTLRI